MKCRGVHSSDWRSVTCLDVSRIIATAAAHDYFGAIAHVNPYRAIASIRERVSWVIAHNVNVTQLVRDLPGQPRQIVDPVRVINRPSAGRGYVRHEVSRMLATVLSPDRSRRARVAFRIDRKMATLGSRPRPRPGQR